MGEIRAYRDDDFDAVARIWSEIRWLDDESKRDALKSYLASGNVEVALVDGAAECMVHWTPGTMRHTDTDLGLCAITGVTTSPLGRKRGFASTMTARALRQGAEAGHALAALGMFEQGFYDRLGFGTGAEYLVYQFDPRELLLGDRPYRQPVRLTPDDWADMHAAMLARQPAHGGVRLLPPEFTESDIGFGDKWFGLGYRDDGGELTHFFFGQLKEEHGPLGLRMVAYRTTDQLLELLRLLRELANQIRSVRMVEPPHVQIQALLREPMRDRHRTRSSEHESGARAVSWWQFRMLDVPTCVAAYSAPGASLEFNLTLIDPAADRLDADGGSWCGVGGDYTITIATTSSASPGHRAGLPLLTTDVNAFTRLWFGVRPAGTLATSDAISAPPELLDALDRTVRTPRPHPGWDF